MSMSQDEIDALISGGDIDESADTDSLDTDTIDTDTPSFPEMENDDTGSAGGGHIISPLDPKLELLFDLQLPVSIELGRSNMLIRDILRLGRGSVIEFDKLVSEPVDVLINGKKVAEGEVVVIDKHFGIRVTTLVDPADRLRSVKR